VGVRDEWQNSRRELDDPRSGGYAARYQPFGTAEPKGFNIRELRSNTVVRGEYRPQSVLFFVYQQGRRLAQDSPETFEFGRDVRGIFDLHPMNTFLVKASFWFNP
jgi:hypothetical protein